LTRNPKVQGRDEKNGCDCCRGSYIPLRLVGDDHQAAGSPNKMNAELRAEVAVG